MLCLLGLLLGQVIPDRSIGTHRAIESAAWSPDGGSVTTGDRDGYVRTWGQRLQWLTALMVGIASGGHDKTVNIWDAATGLCMRNLTGHTDQVMSVAYSPDDGKHIVSGSEDKTLKIWDAATGKCARTLTGHSDAVYSAVYSPDSKHIASGSDDRTVKIWDAATGTCTRNLTGHRSGLQSVAYSPDDGIHLVSGGWDSTVKIWDTATGECMRTITGHTDAVHSVAYSPTGKNIASGSDDKTLEIDSA